jgi:hypothetical protein
MNGNFPTVELKFIYHRQKKFTVPEKMNVFMLVDNAPIFLILCCVGAVLIVKL